MKRTAWMLPLLLALGCSSPEQVMGARQKFEFDPAELDFGEVPVHGTVKMVVQARNVGQASVNATVDEIVGPFEVEPSKFSVAVGEAVELAVRIRPKSEGQIEGEIRFRAGDGTRVSLPLRGRGVDRALRVDPPRIDFGKVVIGERPKAEFKLESMADGDLDVLLTLGGSNEFEISTTPFVIGGRRTVTMEVSFVPRKRGGHAAWLDISPCTDCLPVRVDFTGIAVQGEVALFPSQIRFGSVPPGLSHRMEAELRNIGDAPIVVDELGLESETGVFEIESATPLPRELAPEESLFFTVRFDPRDFELYQAKLFVKTSKEEKRFEVGGRGGGALLVAELLPFGTLPKGWAGSTNVVLRNVGEKDDEIVFTSLELVDSDGAFAVLDDLPLQTGATEWTIPIHVNAKEVGDHEAILLVHTELPFQPTIEIPLSAYVARPECELRFDPPGPIALGIVDGDRPVELEIQVTHDGEGECVVWAPRFEREDGALTFVENPIAGGFHLLPTGETLTFRFASGAVAANSRRTVFTHFVLSHSEAGVAEEVPISFLQSNPLPFMPFQAADFPDTPVGKESIVSLALVPRPGTGLGFPVFTFADEPEEFELLPTNGSNSIVSFRPTSQGRKSVLLEAWWTGFDQPYFIRLEGEAVPPCDEPCDWPTTTCSAEAQVVEFQPGVWRRVILLEASPEPPVPHCIWFSTDGPWSWLPGITCTGGTLTLGFGEGFTANFTQWVWDANRRAARCETSAVVPPWDP